STGECIGRNRLAGRTYLRRMVGKGRWRSLLWKTRSSRAHASWCSMQSTRRISSGSHMGSDPGEDRTMHWGFKASPSSFLHFSKNSNYQATMAGNHGGNHDVCAGGRVRDRGTVIQKKTGRPVHYLSGASSIKLSCAGHWKSSLTSRSVGGPVECCESSMGTREPHILGFFAFALLLANCSSN